VKKDSWRRHIRAQGLQRQKEQALFDRLKRAQPENFRGDDEKGLEKGTRQRGETRPHDA
jgi:hypothetical protein